MKRLCRYCRRDLSHRKRYDYCNAICRIRYRQEEIAEGQKLEDWNELTAEQRNILRWVHLYLNSSQEALRELAGLKTFRIKQVETWGNPLHLLKNQP